MLIKRLAAAALALGAALGVSGCADGYGYGGLSAGYGAGGYYGDSYYDGYGYGDPYGYGYGYGGSPAYFGWYNDFYYPGTGIYVYDRNRRPFRWNDTQRRYWEGRRGSFAGRDGIRDNWNGFGSRPGRGNRGYAYRGNRNGAGPQGLVPPQVGQGYGGRGFAGRNGQGYRQRGPNGFDGRGGGATAQPNAGAVQPPTGAIVPGARSWDGNRGYRGGNGGWRGGGTTAQPNTGAVQPQAGGGASNGRSWGGNRGYRGGGGSGGGWRGRR